MLSPCNENWPCKRLPLNFQRKKWMETETHIHRYSKLGEYFPTGGQFGWYFEVWAPHVKWCPCSPVSSLPIFFFSNHMRDGSVQPTPLYIIFTFNMWAGLDESICPNSSFVSPIFSVKCRFQKTSPLLMVKCCLRFWDRRALGLLASLNHYCKRQVWNLTCCYKSHIKSYDISTSKEMAQTLSY